jgi:hypothetical protein
MTFYGIIKIEFVKVNSSRPTSTNSFYPPILSRQRRGLAPRCKERDLESEVGKKAGNACSPFLLVAKCGDNVLGRLRNGEFRTRKQ